MDPAVAVTWTEYVPFGVVGPPPQPDIPMQVIAASRISPLQESSIRRTLRLRPPSSGEQEHAYCACQREPCAGVTWLRLSPRTWRSSAAVAGLVSVLIVTVAVAVPPTSGVMLDSEKEQMVSFGKLPQLRVVAVAKPLTEVTVSVVVAGLPEPAEPLVGESETVKLGGPGQTVTATAEDVGSSVVRIACVNGRHAVGACDQRRCGVGRRS